VYNVGICETVILANAFTFFSRKPRTMDYLLRTIYFGMTNL